MGNEINSHIGIVLIICLLFIALFFFNHYFLLGLDPTAGSFSKYANGDYDVHLQRTQSILFGEECNENCSNQPYLFHLLAAPFSVRDTGFIYFVILFMGLIIPLTIFKITKEPLSAFFYFTVSKFFWFSRGMFTNIIAIWIVLLFFVFKKWWQRAILLFLSILTHGHGFYLALAACFLIYLFENKNKILHIIPSFLGGCEGKFAEPVKGIVETKVNISATTANTMPYFEPGMLASTFLWAAPLPFFLIGCWGFLKEKLHALLVLQILAIVLLTWSYRMHLLIGLLCVVGVSLAYKHASIKQKRCLLIMALAMGILQFYNFWWEAAKVIGIVC